MKFRFEQEGFDYSNDEVYKIRNEKDLEPKELHAVHEYLNKGLAKKHDHVEEWNQVSFEHFLGLDIKPKIEETYRKAVGIFSEKGFDSVNLLPVYLVSEEVMSGAHGWTTNGWIEIANKDIRQKELKQLDFLSILAHEIYHSTAQSVVDVKKTTNSEGKSRLNISPGTVGASYRSTKGAQKEVENEHSMALEEGLAMVFQEELFDKIKTSFSTQAVNYYMDLLKQGVLENIPEEDYKEDMNIATTIQSENSLEFNFQYYASKELAEYLISEVPDFDYLVEKARLYRQTLDLARAIEKRFGQGSYRRITTAKTHEASILLNQLKNEL